MRAQQRHTNRPTRTVKTPEEWLDYRHLRTRLARQFNQPTSLHGEGAAYYLTLQNSARRIYAGVVQLASDSKRRVPVENLNHVLESVAGVLLHTQKILQGEPEPSGKELLTEYMCQLQKASRRLRPFTKGKIVAAALSCLLGSAIIAASGIIGALSFGLAAPITILGTVFGTSLIIGGVSAVTAAAGVGLLLFSGAKAKEALMPDPLRKEIAHFVSIAKRLR